MRDFAVRHTNRGESQKTQSRRAVAKFKAGVTKIQVTPQDIPADVTPPPLLTTPGDSATPSQIGSQTASRTHSPTRDGSEQASGDEESERPKSGRRDRVARHGKSKLRHLGAGIGSAETQEADSADEEEDYLKRLALFTTPAQWQTALQESIEALVDRKKAKSNQLMREKYLATIIYVLRHVYAAEEISSRLEELIPALLRSAKTEAEDDQREARLALEALSLVAITLGTTTAAQSVSLFASKSLRRIFSTTPSNATKAHLVTTIGILAYFGRVPKLTLIESVLPFFAEIIHSDGKAVDAKDSAEVVTAAQEMWAFVCTRTGVARDSGATEAMEGFLDQLDSTDVGVQVSAGEAIVSVYEMTYARKQAEEGSLEEYDSDLNDEEPDRPAGTEEDGEKGSDAFAGNPSQPAVPTAEREDVAAARCRKHFDQVFPPLPTHQYNQLLEKVKELSRSSGRSISADSRRQLKASFSDIYNSLSRHPVLGPRYQTSVDWETGRERGNRTVITLGNEDLPIRHWWQWVRWGVLKRVMKNGLAVHFAAGNGCVVDALTKTPPSARAWSGAGADDSESEDELLEGYDDDGDDGKSDDE